MLVRCQRKYLKSFESCDLATRDDQQLPVAVPGEKADRFTSGWLERPSPRPHSRADARELAKRIHAGRFCQQQHSPPIAAADVVRRRPEIRDCGVQSDRRIHSGVQVNVCVNQCDQRPAAE